MIPDEIRQSVLDQIANALPCADKRVPKAADSYLFQGRSLRKAFQLQAAEFGLVIIHAGPTTYRILNTVTSLERFRAVAQKLPKTDRSYQLTITSPARLPRRNK